MAPLAPQETLDLQDSRTQALARLEAAALGLPIAMLQPFGHPAGQDAEGGGAPGVVGGLIVGGGQRERALRRATGPLARALEERRQRIR